MRASVRMAVILVPPISELEQARSSLMTTNLVEVTPTLYRIRKRHLTENDRRRANRGQKEEVINALTLKSPAK